jgi:hypothetical protein
METTVLEIVAPAITPDAISATAQAIQARDSLLTIARAGKCVKDAASAQRATTILKEITAFTRLIEDTRTTVKAPILEAGKRIDTVAKTLTTDLELEAKRIGGLIGAFQTEQKRIEEEQRRRAWEEQERIRLDAERKEREAREKAEAEERERQRKLREEQEARDRAAREEQEKLRAAAERTRTEAGRAKREQELREAQEKAERERREADARAERERLEREQRERDEAEKRRQEAAAASARAAQVSIQTARKIEGIATGTELKFEVFDIQALYDANAAFVILSPNNAALKAALKALPAGQSLPGVRHWREAKTVVR